jgi:hypothetical protein
MALLTSQCDWLQVLQVSTCCRWLVSVPAWPGALYRRIRSRHLVNCGENLCLEFISNTVVHRVFRYDLSK